MAAHNLSREDAEAALALLQQHGGNMSAASKASGIPRGTLQARIARAPQILGQPAEEPVTVAPSKHLPYSSDEAWNVLDGWIGRKRAPKEEAPQRALSRDRRIVVAGDFHAPFHDPEVVATLIAEEGPKTDTLIVSGDLMDFYSISRFLKYEHIPIEQEIAGADALLGQLSHAFADVVLVEGNHDAPRFEKQLRSLVSLDMMHVIELLTGGNLSVIKMLAKRYPNVRFAPQPAGNHSLGWMTQMGDLIVTHAEKFSVTPGAAVRKIEEGLADFEHVYNLQPWRVLIQAHTHAYSLIPWHADKLLGESGCCCLTHGYQLTARMGGRPQRQGYVSLTQHDGKTDINSVKFHWLNAERRVA